MNNGANSLIATESKYDFSFVKSIDVINLAVHLHAVFLMVCFLPGVLLNGATRLSIQVDTRR